MVLAVAAALIGAGILRHQRRPAMRLPGQRAACEAVRTFVENKLDLEGPVAADACDAVRVSRTAGNAFLVRGGATIHKEEGDIALVYTAKVQGTAQGMAQEMEVCELDYQLPGQDITAVTTAACP